MKKFFFSAAILAAMCAGMISCSNKEKCWEIKISAGPLSTSTYFWGTKADAQAIADAGGSMATLSATSKSKSECDPLGN